MTIRSQKTLYSWLGSLKTVVLGVPLLFVSCGTAPQPTLPGEPPAPRVSEVTHPQAYYHFLRGSLHELNNENDKAIESYQAGLELDHDSIFLKYRIAKLYFATGQKTAAVDTASQIPVEDVDNITIVLGLAKIFSGSGEQDKAIQVLEVAQEKFPDQDRMYLAHGSLLLNKKDFSGAEGVFQALLVQNPKSEEAEYYLGLIAVHQNTPDQAIEHFENAIALNTSFERAYVKLVAVLEEEKNSRRAIEVLEKFLDEVNANHREFRLRLVRLYVEMKEAEKGLKHLDQLLDHNPNDLHAQVRKAQIFGELGQFPQAIEELKAILRVRPNELRVRDFLGLLYEETKDYPLAIQAYQENLKIDPTFFDSVLHLGFVTYRLKRNEQAISYLNNAVELNPRRPEPYLLLGLTYFQMKDYQGAKVKLEEGILQDPSNAELHFNLGTAWDKLDRFDEVVREMEQTLELNPDHADALNYLGYSYADRGIEVEKALELTQRAVELKPHNGYYVDSLAWALYKLGRVDEALETIQRAVALVKDDPVIYEHLGEIYLLQNERDKAREVWLHSLQLDSTNETLKKRFQEVGFGEPIPNLSQKAPSTP